VITKGDRDPARARMGDRVGQRLLDDPIRRDFDRPGELDRVPVLAPNTIRWSSSYSAGGGRSSGLVFPTSRPGARQSRRSSSVKNTPKV
jgi:hypothetical protein